MANIKKTKKKGVATDTVVEEAVNDEVLTSNVADHIEQPEMEGEINEETNTQEIIDEFTKSTEELENKVSEGEDIKDVLEEELEKVEKTEQRLEESIKKDEEKVKKIQKFVFGDFWNGISYT